MICCCQRLLHHCRFGLSHRQANKAIIIASTTRPVYTCKNLQLVQVNTIRMLSSLIKYDAVLKTVVCDLRHLLFVAWWIQDLSFFPIKAYWYGYRLVHWSYGDVIRDGGFSSVLSDALRPIYLVPAFFDDEHAVDPYVVELRSKTKSPVEGHMFGPHWVEVRSVTKSSDEGHIFGPHLVKVCSETKSSDEGHILDHIWLKSSTWQSPSTRGTHLDHIWSKSAVRQSSPTRGTFWNTFGWSPLHDKVLQWRAKFGPHLVKVRCMTESSDKGCDLYHIWSKSTVRQSPPTRGIIF